MANSNPKTEQLLKSPLRDPNASKPEAKKIRQKGAIASNKVQAKKKEFGQILTEAIAVIGRKVANEQSDPAVKKLIEVYGYDIFKFVKALNENLSANELVSLLRLGWSYKYGLPVEKIKTENYHKIENINLNVVYGNKGNSATRQNKEIKK